MLDSKLLRTDPEGVQNRLRTKDPSIDLSSILALDHKSRALRTEVEELKARRNHLSKAIGEKKRLKEDASALMNEVAGLGEATTRLDHELTAVEKDLHHQLSLLPNLPEEGIPVSLEPSDNVCIKSVGERPHFAFPFKNHVELNEKLKLFDFKRGAKVAGSGWITYMGAGAVLEWALIRYMMDQHLARGFTPWMVPHLVREEILFGSGQLPKFEKQVFRLQDEEHPLYLIPTAEVALNGLHFDEILSADELPKKYVAYTPCFRREAGAAGSQERGLIRTHQFNKVEMFAFARPEESDDVFDQMLASAESILQGLGLHYRNMLLVTGDMSFAAQKTVDIEVYLPGQNRYYEVSSVSHCGDYQARRSQIRYKQGEEKAQLVHTLNGSGLATSRLMVALLENNQRADGSIALPPALFPYLNGLTHL
jgi:seryl-tRNA synthetase